MLYALCILLTAVLIGAAAHELSHAAALEWFGIEYTIEWFPARADGRLRMAIEPHWATVTYQAIPSDVQAWKLRVAAIMPLVLALPLVPMAIGVLPDPIGTENLYLSLAIIGWLACAIPSPADFAIFWHPERSLARWRAKTD